MGPLRADARIRMLCVQARERGFCIFPMPPSRGQRGRGPLCLLGAMSAPSTHRTTLRYFAVCQTLGGGGRGGGQGCVYVSICQSKHDSEDWQPAVTRPTLPASLSENERRASLGLKEGPYMTDHPKGHLIIYFPSDFPHKGGFPRVLQPRGLREPCPSIAEWPPGRARLYRCDG